VLIVAKDQGGVKRPIEHNLPLDEFDSPILGLAGIGAVGSDGDEGADAVRIEAGGCDVVVFDEGVDYGLRPVARQGNVVVEFAGGVGVAGLGTFAILGSMANSKFDDLEKACPNEQCPPEREGDIDDGERLQTFANISLGVGVAGVATGAALLIFGGGKGDEPKRKATAELVIGIRSIQVRGKFW